MLVSPLASSTVAPTSLSGTEPSGRWTVGTQAYARSAADTSPAASSAIAASTWFQTSVWPPGTHGIAPEGSCAATMLAAVALTSRRGEHAVQGRDLSRHHCAGPSRACGSRAPATCR